MERVVALLICVNTIASAPFFDQKDMDKIKDIVDQEIMKREIDLLITKRMEIAKNPEQTRLYFEKQMKSSNISNPSPQQQQQATGSASTKAHEHPEEKEKSISNPPPTENNNIDDFCMDIYETKECVLLRDEFQMCDNKEHRLDVLCKDTCGFCPKKAHMPVDCDAVEFGCCSDRVTARADPYGKNCPKCEDGSPELCKIGTRDDCNDVNMLGNWMRTHCKRLCGVCTDEVIESFPEDDCFDDPEQKDFCPSWERDGLCKHMPSLMAKHCALSCKICIPKQHRHHFAK